MPTFVSAMILFDQNISSWTVVLLIYLRRSEYFYFLAVSQHWSTYWELRNNCCVPSSICTCNPIAAVIIKIFSWNSDFKRFAQIERTSFFEFTNQHLFCFKLRLVHDGDSDRYKDDIVILLSILDSQNLRKY